MLIMLYGFYSANLSGPYLFLRLYCFTQTETI